MVVDDERKRNESIIGIFRDETYKTLLHYFPDSISDWHVNNSNVFSLSTATEEVLGSAERILYKNLWLIVHALSLQSKLARMQRRAPVSRVTMVKRNRRHRRRGQVSSLVRSQRIWCRISLTLNSDYLL